MDDQPVFTQFGPIMHKTIGAVESVRMLFANSLDFAPHVFATVAIHRLVLQAPTRLFGFHRPDLGPNRDI